MIINPKPLIPVITRGGAMPPALLDQHTIAELRRTYPYWMSHPYVMAQTGKMSPTPKTAAVNRSSGRLYPLFRIYFLTVASAHADIQYRTASFWKTYVQLLLLQRYYQAPRRDRGILLKRRYRCCSVIAIDKQDYLADADEHTNTEPKDTRSAIVHFRIPLFDLLRGTSRQ